ncbi:MAG: hypothetical protein MUO72_13465 [Bacteroidales bacterium]|nr:hypothetical protein [Bacteroidales bacterium]
MKAYEIAELKDNILKDLSKRPNKRESLEATYINLHISNVPIEVVRGYVEEMTKDGVISSNKISNDRTLLILKDQGKKLLFEGGYAKRLEKEIEVKEQQKVDNENYRYKNDLEIKNLKASIENYKDSKTWAIIAIIISILTLAYSIFFK